MEPSIRIEVVTANDLSRLASQGQLWAVVDACDEPEVPPKIDELGIERAACLYRIRKDDERWPVAPFLVAVDSSTLAWIAARLWSRPWGFFAVAGCDLATLRKHFRTLITVQDSKGQKLLFRFWDPRVLNVYLPTCTPDELVLVFGPVAALGIADSKSEKVTLAMQPGTRSPLAPPTRPQPR